MNEASEKPLLLYAADMGQRYDDCACPEGSLRLHAPELDEPGPDCACPSGCQEHQPPISGDEPFAIAEGTFCIPLPRGFVLAFSPYTPGGPCVLNEAGHRRWQDFLHPLPLHHDFDRSLARQGLILPARLPPPRPVASSMTLTVWLHITNACNLDCPYCYVRKSSEAMDLEVGIRSLDRVMGAACQHGFRKVKIKYAGGEATLHFHRIQQLHAYATQKAQELGLKLEEVILSNGTILQPEDADWIAAEGIQVMISLDGIGEQHDLLRSSRGGRGTFSRVEQTVDQILIPRGVRPAITMTITGLNAMAAADVARWALIERDLALSFNFYRRNILSASRSDLELEERRIIEGLLAAYAVIETHLPSRPFFNGLLDRVHAGSHAHPCGAGHDYLVITHRGEFAQCHMLLEQPVRTNPDGDPLLAIRYGPLQNPRGDEKEGCQSCPFRFHCAGGCPLETYRATGRWDVRSPHCRIYQTLLPAALRLEGLRLMKIHGYL
jgi:uncharacterized protein